MAVTTRTRPVFYLVMAGVAALIAVVGFSHRYLFPLAERTFKAPAIVHLHGVIMFAWISLFVIQAALVATGRTSTHRGLGMAGIAIGTLVVYTAAFVAILLLAHELKEVGRPSVREFVANLISLDLTVAGLFAFAIAYVNRPEVHKRLMLMTTFVILTPALARIIQLLAPDMTRLLRNDLAMLPSDVLILIAILYDWRTRGRPHPAYLIGGGAVVAIQLVFLLIRGTPAWYAVADSLAKLVG